MAIRGISSGRRNAPVKNIMRGLIAAAAALFLLPLISAGEVVTGAQAKSYKNGYVQRHYTSRFNPNKSVVVKIRPDHLGGHEVLLPSGYWVNCGTSCRWTVEREYLDIHEYQKQPFGPGYFRFNF